MPNKDPQLVDRHALKDRFGWVMGDQERRLCSLTNSNPTAHAQWVEVETRPLRGTGPPVVRRMLRLNALEAWETRQISGGRTRLQAMVTVNE